MTTAAALSVADVTVRFAGVVALSEVSFGVSPGDVHSVIGPNGAGKSSLFNVLSGIYRPVSGSARIDDTDLIGKAPHRIAAMGVGRAFQNSSTFAGLSVAENILLGRHRHTRGGIVATGLGMPWARREERAARERAAEVADFLGIAAHLRLPAAQLPYGLQKRVDIARALVGDPRLLLLDEPAAGMHTHEKTELRQIVRRIADERQITVLLVEHDMAMVMSISDQVTVLDFGTVITTGPPAEVGRDPRVVAAYLGKSGPVDAPAQEARWGKQSL